MRHLRIPYKQGINPTKELAQFSPDLESLFLDLSRIVRDAFWKWTK